MLNWERDDHWCESAVLVCCSVHIHSIGQWWVEDADDRRLDGGYLPGCTRDQLKRQAEDVLRHRLRMAAETLDSSWLEVPEQVEARAPDDAVEEEELEYESTGSVAVDTVLPKPLTREALSRGMENMFEIPFWDGVWRTPPAWDLVALQDELDALLDQVRKQEPVSGSDQIAAAIREEARGIKL